MSWIKVILDLLAKGLEAWNNYQLLRAGKALEREENDKETIKALEARDAVDASNADKFLLPPGER